MKTIANIISAKTLLLIRNLFIGHSEGLTNRQLKGKYINIMNYKNDDKLPNQLIFPLKLREVNMVICTVGKQVMKKNASVLYW